LVRLNQDGPIDESFDLGSGFVGSGSNGALSFSQVLPQPDGKVVVVGSFVSVSGTARANAARLNSDGSLDATFAPDGDLLGPNSSLLLLPDGRFMLFFTPSSGTTLLSRRLTTTGAIDPTFSPMTIQIPFAGSSYPRIRASVSVDSHGRFLTVVSPLSIGRDFGTALFRLQPDGSLDSGFNAQLRERFSWDTLLVVGGKILYSGSQQIPPPAGTGAYRVVGRLNDNGTSDSSWPERAYSAGQFGNAPGACLLPDGSIVALVPLARDLEYPMIYQLQHIDTAYQIDRNYCGFMVVGGRSGLDDISQLLPLPGGQLLAVGSFTALNGVPRTNLARLIPDTHYAATRLTALSVRANAGSGDQTLIVGLSVSGSGQKTMLVRGVGPGLAAYGVNGTLADPQLTLFNGSTALLANDNWSDGTGGTAVAAVTAQVQNFPLAPGSKDAAVVTALAGGLYTMHVTGHGSTGVALAEAYDADPAPADFTAARVVSFSARTQAGVDDQTLIAGFIVDGPDAKRLLIRAVGPGLTAYGVSGVLADPMLTLYQGNTVIATNDDWNSDSISGSALQSAAQQTGAFALGSSSKDSALLVTLSPGRYTALVSGKNGTTGVALVEVYEVP
jgi:uncharacterized delta-60 repeat protein